MDIRDRIVDFRRVKASELVPHPDNWRTHPQTQREAVAGILSEVGYVDALICRTLPDGRLGLIDGHLRQDLTPDAEVPVLVVDLDDAEASKVLATFDPLAAMAEANNEALAGLLRELKEQNVPLESIGWPDWKIEPLLAAEWNPPDIEPLPEGSDASKCKPIAVTPDQRETIDRAIEKCRAMTEDTTLSEGRCIELICADYLAGP